MTQHVLPILATLVAWWAGTGAILWLDGRPRGTYRYSMAAATVLLVAALYGLAATRDAADAGAPFVAFACSMLVWAWIEMSFLLGYVTGPRTAPCPAGVRGPARAFLALQTIAYHELALVVGGAAVFTLAAGGANPVGWWTFLVLYAMRQSAKLNVFLGVRNVGEEFLPPHLRYLETYFRRRPMNPLFPVVVAAAGMLTVHLWRAAFAPDAGAFAATSLTFAAALLTLALVEHAFLVLPLPAGTLWGFTLRAHGAARAEDTALPALVVPGKGPR